MHRDDDIQVETVGEVFPNVRVGITPEGELVVRGPVVTSGYYNQPEKTEEALDGEWLHTDDFGAITDDGHIKVFDRMDDVMELSDGTASHRSASRRSSSSTRTSRRRSSPATGGPRSPRC